MAFFDFLKSITHSGKNDRRRQLEAASFRQDALDDSIGCGRLEGIRIKEEMPSMPEIEINPHIDAELEPGRSSCALRPAAEEKCPAAAAPVPGGIYAMRERNGGLYRLVKVVHAEDGLVHVLRYAGRFFRIPEQLSEAELTLAVDVIDGSFGAEHLPILEQFFAANSIHVQDIPLTDSDFRGWRLYVDSIYDCLSDTAPAWLRKAGSYAAWRDDLKAMAVLADRYLIGATLPRDSKKALYWLNRIVQQGIGIVQPGETVKEEYQILTGGIYVCAAEKDSYYSVCKAALKDKQGVQLLLWPVRFEQQPRKNPARLVEQAGEELTCISLTADAFLSRRPMFMGLLPITLEEILCYRNALRQMCGETDLQPSTFEQLLQRAESGDAEAQLEAAQVYLTGDPELEVEENIPEAVRLLTDAANLGYGPAAHALALLCRNGAGICVAPDERLSFDWLLYAAQLDYGPAQLEAAECCLSGLGCPCDPALAHAWFSVAASHDSNQLTLEQKNQAKSKRLAIDADLAASQRAKARDYFRQIQDSF